MRSRREEERVSDRGGGTQKERRTQKISEDKINEFRMRGELERAESTETLVIVRLNNVLLNLTITKRRIRAFKIS